MAAELKGHRVAILAVDGVDRRLAEASPDEFDALLLPGATVNPASFPSIRTDLRNAGGDVVDEEVVVDQSVASSRSPDDLPAFCPTIVEVCSRGRRGARQPA